LEGWASRSSRSDGGVDVDVDVIVIGNVAMAANVAVIAGAITITSTITLTTPGFRLRQRRGYDPAIVI
jgi:hypothetical protein